MEQYSPNITWRTRLLIISVLLFSAHTYSLAQTLNSWINEIHYDNAGADAGEAIEVVVETNTVSDFDISKLKIELYNGSNGMVDKDLTLSLENVGNHIPPFTIYSISLIGIENGEPDGIALSYNGTFIQFLSYEGSFTAINGTAAGEISIDIGVEEVGDTPLNYSLQLTGTGDRYETFTWNEAATETFGAQNHDQSLKPIDGPQPVTDFKQVFIAPDKVAISWTKPIGIYTEDWDGVLVFASDQGKNQIDLTAKDYTSFNGGDKIFGEGTKIGNSFTVLRQDADNNDVVTITGLEFDKSFHFISYSSKVLKDEHDKFSNPSNEIEIIPKVSNVTDLEAIPLGKKVKLSWTNSMGDHSDWWHEIMIIASENEITAVPDQKLYLADPTFGNAPAPNSGEFIVFAGADSVAFIEGLENGKAYHFKVFVRYDSEDFYWSSGVAATCIPFDNKKLWTGNAKTNLFMDANNWSPVGVPGKSHDVILDNSTIDIAYEVELINATPIELNSLTISPQNTSNITLALKSEENNEMTLTLHDNTSPLTISDYGILKNSLTNAVNTLILPNNQIKIADQGKYIHNTGVSHKEILDKISLNNGIIPGTIEFNVPGEGSYATSLVGRTFNKLVFSSESGISYNAGGKTAFTVKEALIINENNILNLGGFEAPVVIEGDLTIDGALQFTNEIIFSGNDAQTLSSKNTSPILLNKIKIDKTANDLILGADLKVLERLEFVTGNLETSENQVILDYLAEANPAIIGASENAKVKGNLKVLRNVPPQETAFKYAGIVFKEGSEDLGDVSVIRNSGPDAVINNGTSKSIAKNWVISTSSELTTPRDVEFTWSEADEGDFEPLNVQLWQETEVKEEWAPVGELTDGTARTLTAALTRFSRFTISDKNNPLPVNLLFFQVSSDKDKALLEWATSGELNNAGFEIQKSMDGSWFYKIGYVTGSINAVETTEYHFEDLNFQENAYYRLNQIDLNGLSTFSSIRYLAVESMTSDEKLFTLSPNPLQFPIKLKYSNNKANNTAEVNYCCLYSSFGKKIYEITNCEVKLLENKLNDLLPNLQDGLYILSLSAKTHTQKIKLIVD